MSRVRREQTPYRAGQEVFLIDGRFVLVENIPATVCGQCGEATFSRETTEKIRRMVHGGAEPIKTVPPDVFPFS
jgi:HTH-type transcriptional regulator/antitoxin MqsA